MYDVEEESDITLYSTINLANSPAEVLGNLQPAGQIEFDALPELLPATDAVQL